MDKLRQLFVGAATIVALAGIPKDATAQDLTMALNTPKDKTEMPALLTLDQIANKRIERGKKQVPETEREKFGKIAKEIIKDIFYETGGEGFDDIVRKNNYTQWEDLLMEMGMGVTEDGNNLMVKLDRINEEGRKANEEGRKANEEGRKANEEGRKANEEGRKAIIEGLPNNEKEILSLKTEGKSIEQIKTTYGKEIQGILDLFVKYNYSVSQETIERLKKLGMPTEKLTIKSGRITNNRKE